MCWWFTTFTASSIKNKVQLLGGVEYLYHLIPPDQLEVPSFILDYDYRASTKCFSKLLLCLICSEFYLPYLALSIERNVRMNISRYCKLI